MGIVLKETLKGSIYQYIGVLLGGLNIAILFPNYLGDENFGVLNIIVSLVLIASQFTQLGGPSIVLKYFPRAKNEDHQRYFVSLSFILSTIGTLLFVICYFFFRDTVFSKYNGDWTSNLSLLLTIPFFVLFNTLFQLLCSYLIISYKSAQVFFLREFLLRLIQTASIGIYLLFDLSFVDFVYLYVLSYLIVLLFAFFNLIRSKVFALKDLFAFKRGMPIKEYLQYGFYTIVAGFSSSFVSNIDILMIGALLASGEVESGKYKTAIYLTTLVSIPLRPLFQIMYSMVSNWWKQNKNKEIEKMYQQSAQYGILVSSILLSLLLININWLEGLVFKNLKDSFWIILFFGMGQFIVNATGINGLIINLSKYYKVTTYSIFVLAVLNFGLNYSFIQWFGVAGAALATGISLSVINIFKLIFVSHKLKLKVITKALRQILLVSLLGLALISVLQYTVHITWQMSIFLNLLALGIILIYVKRSGLIAKLKVLTQKK